MGGYSGRCNPRVHGTWLGQLWAWMSGQGIGLRLKGVVREGRAHDESSTRLLPTLFTGRRERSEVEAGCSKFGVRRKADLRLS